MRLIDADKMQELAFQFNFEGRITERELYLFNRAIEEMPTIDAVPVVRCKDCKWWKTVHPRYWVEHEICAREGYELLRKAEDFCSRGKRREDGTN